MRCLKYYGLSAGFVLALAHSVTGIAGTLLVDIMFPATESFVSQQEFDASGYYLPQGRLPKDFRGIEHLALFPNARKADRMPASGIYAKNGAVFKLTSPTTIREKLSFTTTTIRGVSYGFDGQFLSNHPADEDPEKSVLEGQLSKYLNGKKVAESIVRWSYYSGE